MVQELVEVAREKHLRVETPGAKERALYVDLSAFTNIGDPMALCITRGSHQYLYSAHSGDPFGMDDAAIYKVELDGRVVGKFGKAGKLVKEFVSVPLKT